MSAIDTSLDGQRYAIAVPDDLHRPRSLESRAAGLRRAIRALEYGLGDRAAWELYADLGDLSAINITANVYGKRFKVPQRSKAAA